ncbi:hypothetical protein VTN49DRAFT_6895 [Thermomyces lanuginosus]|uniref:uncharacterized protein n=1 Tax=Thermomyces lanuginosus TaxID=5541 RepID=UPI003743795B
MNSKNAEKKNINDLDKTAVDDAQLYFVLTPLQPRSTGGEAEVYFFTRLLNSHLEAFNLGSLRVPRTTTSGAYLALAQSPSSLLDGVFGPRYPLEQQHNIPGASAPTRAPGRANEFKSIRHDFKNP